MTAMTEVRRVVKRTRFAFSNSSHCRSSFAAIRPGGKRSLEDEPQHGTLPMFRTAHRRRHHPGDLRQAPYPYQDRTADGNHLGLVIRTTLRHDQRLALFHQSGPVTRLQWMVLSRTTTEYLPLYEAKMLDHFDHRFSTYNGATQAPVNVGSLPCLTAKEHDDPDIESLARYRVNQAAVAAQLEKWTRMATRSAQHNEHGQCEELLCQLFSHVRRLETRSSSRYLIIRESDSGCTGWSTLAFDYVARQKLGDRTSISFS